MGTILTMYRRQLTEASVGVILAGPQIIQTLERPWEHDSLCRGGKPFKSCIPYGKYELIPHSSTKHGEVWALQNTDVGVYHYAHEREYETDRYGVLIHVANWVRQLSGCIAPGQGMMWDEYESVYRVVKSGLARKQLRRYLDKNECTHLEIKRYETTS